MPGVVEFFSAASGEAESEFHEWRVANRSQGYILNPEGDMLHKASCRHFGGDLKTYTAFPKICFENRMALTGWWDDRKFTTNLCGTCQPRAVPAL